MSVVRIPGYRRLQLSQFSVLSVPLVLECSAGCSALFHRGKCGMKSLFDTGVHDGDRSLPNRRSNGWWNAPDRSGAEVPRLKPILAHKALWLLFALNAAMFLIEVAAGLAAESMGLVADGLDMLADASVYGLALVAVGQPDASKVRAAFAAGYLQLALASVAALKLSAALVIGSDPEPAAMIGVSLLALAVNAIAVGILRRHRHGDVHIRAAWIFSATDVQVNLLVIAAAMLVRGFHSAIPDLVVGAAICFLVFRSVWRILSDARRTRAALAASHG
jgi:Co/Zn/Cd efflux system component